MRYVSIALTALLFVTGCQALGGAEPTDEADSGGARSGARLKRRMLTTKDGAQQFVGWFDTERQETCSFRRVEWNVDRCIPDENVIEAADRLDSVIYYSDPSCTTPIVLRGGPSINDCWHGSVSNYVVVDDSLSCKQIDFQVFKAGKRLAEDDSDETMPVFALDNGECVTDGDRNANEYSPLTLVDLTEFAEGSERIE